MPDSIFCPKCGTPNQADFMYCTSCGFALSTIGKAGAEKITPSSSTPVYNQPAVPPAPAKAGMPRWAPAVIIIVVLAGIGFLIWNNEQSKKDHSGKQSGLTGQNDDGITVITDQPDKIKLKDFAGVWRAYETSDPTERAKLGDPKDDLFIEVSNGRITMNPRSELDKEESEIDITCDEVIGNSISCIIKSKKHSDDGSAGTIKLELQPSKNDMTVTITQSQSSEEKLVVKARRLNDMGN